MKAPVIVGLHGKGGSGKSTFADMLVEKTNSQFRKVNFKDALVDLAKYIGWNGVKDEKGRKFLQTLATDAIRDCIDHDYWVKAWEERVLNLITNDPFKRLSFVADDVRFDNEAEGIAGFAAKNGFEFYIVRLVTPNQKEVMTQEAKSHKSESGIDESYIDLTITMEYGLEFVSKEVDIFLRSINFLERKPNAEYYGQHLAGEGF